MKITITISEDNGVLVEDELSVVFDGGPYDSKELALYWAMRESAEALGLSDFDTEIHKQLGPFISAKEEERDDARDDAIGRALALELGLRRLPGGRFHMRGGDKTLRGLTRTLRRIIEEGTA